MGKQGAQTTHQTFVKATPGKRRGRWWEHMNIDIKEFGEIYTNKHELRTVQRWSVLPMMSFSPLQVDLFSHVRYTLRIAEEWIIYKNISRANKVAHSFVLLTAMTQDSSDIKTGFICSNATRSVRNWSHQQGHSELHIKSWWHGLSDYA